MREDDRKKERESVCTVGMYVCDCEVVRLEERATDQEESGLREQHIVQTRDANLGLHQGITPRLTLEVRRFLIS